jgi:hypothetical protein
MTKIRVDETLSNQLHQVGEVVELCDPSGAVLGRFIPLIDPSKWQALTPEASEQELDQREQEADEFTTTEMLAHLESLGCSESDGKSPQ